VFGPVCVYGQVIKTRRNDRIVKVERRAVIGAGRLKQALRDSEDSVKLNTSFVERLNLTIRQGSAYLGRRTICQARWKQCLEDHPGAVALPLQFRSTSPGWVDQKGADVQRNLLIEGAFSGVEECPLHALQFGPSGQLSYSGSAPGSLATIDDGSTRKCREVSAGYDTVSNVTPDWMSSFG
jgi:hypothetical protein